ncbi:MAG: FG-GAP-like repeat-containing protein, partial [Acidobacteria bacterium]|nr:FG-GAP-like repeat-containing protein [Acidobacteriota bacterium]
MTTRTLIRVIICTFIACAIFFLMPDQIRDPFINRNANYSFAPFTRDEQNIDSTTRTRLEQAYGKLPMRFEANEGQTDARAKFIARGAGYAVFLTDDETVLQLRKGKSGNERAGAPEKQIAGQPGESVVLRMKLAGSNHSSRVSGLGKLQTTSNYFIGNNPAAWRSRVSNYSKVKYESVYPGIDLVWYGNQQLHEHDFLVAAGADPSRIKFSFSGTDKMSIDAEGSLVLRAGGEDLRLLKPVAWQESNGSRRTVNCDYRLSNKDQVEFRLGDYDKELPLVIDPVLIYSTYIGGIGTDTGQDIAVDCEGAAYITGQTSSADFPGPSPIQPVRGTLMDAYLLKINPAGDAVVFGTWIGGNGNDIGSSISVDLSGNTYLAGSTTSLNFPLQNPLQTSRNGLTDAFAVKINASGSMLLYSTYIGGTGIDGVSSLVVDANGNLYLTGSTDSGDFPLANAFQPLKNGSGAHASDNGGESWNEIGNGLRGADVNDIAIAPGDSSTMFAGTDRGVFKSVDRGVSWNLLGGNQLIRNINQVIVDPSIPDILYAVSAPQLFKSIDGGATWSPKPILPIRTLAIDPTTPSKLFAGTFNGISLSTNGGDTWTPVFIPPGSIGQVESIVFDPITPTTIYLGSSRGVYKSIDGGATWAFTGNGSPTIRIAISGSNPATLYALGTNAIIFKSINAGANWVSLSTPAIGIFSSFPWPLVVSPVDPDVVYVGSRSMGIFRSNDGGATWNTINNGLSASDIRALAIDTNSPEKLYAGSDSGSEAFIAKLDATGSSFVYSSYLGGTGSEAGVGIVVDSSGAAYIAGSTTSANFPVVNAYQPTLAGLGDAFVARINETGSALSWATFLGGSSFDNASGIALSTSGEVFVTGTTSSSNFPVINAIQTTLNGSQDGFISRLRNDGSALDFSTYLGGTGFELATAIAVDTAGNPYVTGLTNSLDFPVIDAVQSTKGGNPPANNTDAFVIKLSTDGTAIVYSTYLGGNGTDQGNSIAVDTSANAYVTGIASSSDFPTTPFPIRPAGPSDAFVTKIGVSADLAITVTGVPNPVMINNQLTYTLTVTNNGADPAINVRVTDTLPTGVSLVSSVTSQGNCSSTSEISCELGNLAAGSNAIITIIVTPSTPGTIINRANVTSGTQDINPANNSATLEANVSLLPSIYGRVTTGGGAGLSGVSVAVSEVVRPPVVTVDDGNYQFAELVQGGNYTVTPSRQGYVFNPPNRTINNLQSDQRADFGGVACIFSISSASQSFPATGGVGSVTITSPDPQCPWTATSNVPWIKFITASGNGSAIASFKVEPTVGSRNGTITISGNTIRILQEFNACNTTAFNTPKFLPVRGISANFGLQKLVAEDFNNDSVSDLVFYGTQPAPSLYIALSNAAGGYDDAGIFYSGGVRTIRTGDLNSDGMNDLALITNESAARLIILTGNGMGGFSTPVRIETVPFPIDLAIADYNNDSISDLAVAPTFPFHSDPFQGLANLAIHLGDGAGGFAPPTNIGFTMRPFSFLTQIESGDFDGDGKADLAVVDNAGPVPIFIGDGAGGFTISTIENTRGTNVLALGDFNNDLKSDIALSRGGEISIWLSTTTGIFEHVQTVNELAIGLLAADLNSDGRSDILAPVSNDSIFVRYARSDGRLTDPVYYLTGGDDIFGLIDLKRDGRNLRTDLLIPISSFGSSSPPVLNVSILTLDKQGGFDAPRAFNFDVPPPNPSHHFTAADMESGDLNGDGVLDLVVVGRESLGSNGIAAMMFGNGRGEFGPHVPINSTAGENPIDVELRDFNHDGNADLAWLNTGTQTLVVMLGNGRGEFTPSATFNTAFLARALASADFNNDGHLDLVANIPSGGLGLFLGDGQGGFTLSTTGIGGNLFNIVFTTGDLNGDGHPDLALFDGHQAPTSDGFKMVILFGNGQGGFGNPINLTTNEHVSFLSAADLNLDGRDDLIYNQLFGNPVFFVALSNPGGSFAVPVLYQGGFTIRSVQAKDINGDSKPDLIVTAENVRGRVSIRFGNGDGSFNQPVNLLDFDSPKLAITGDFDEDGSLDLAVGRRFNSRVGIFKNKSICVPEASVVPVSSASFFRYRVARNSLVTLQGENLATTTRAAIPIALPTTLANTRVKITDSAGVERFAQLSFVSPNRITLLIPPQTSPGVALITVTN